MGRRPKIPTKFTQLSLFPIDVDEDIEPIVSAVCSVLDCPYELLMGMKIGQRSTLKVAIVKQLICYFWGRYKPCHYRVVMKLLRYSGHARITTNRKLTVRILTVDKILQDQVNQIERILTNNSLTTNR